MSRMETYPASISLGEESAQMWRLNKHLEAYLSRVKALEEENELLRAEILHLKSTKSNRSIIREYHDEIMKLRDALDDGHQEMVQVETDRDCIYQEIEYVKELCLQEKQAQEDVKKELSESKKLLEEEKRAQIWLRERLIHLEEEMEDILKVHEEEKAQMEEEISSYSQRLENLTIAPANFKPVNVEDYANQLSQIWQGAVEEYKIEVSALEANLSQAKDNLQKVLDENKQSQIQLQNLERDLQSLKSRKEMLEELLAKQWLEQQDEEGRLQLEIETLEKEKQDLRVQIAQVLEDRQQLMHLKMSLSLEVATYRSLLETESTRLYTPSADYKVASSFSDSLLEQKTFRKRRNENTKPLVSRDNRLNANKRQSAEASKDRYINVKSTSFLNKASPVTKEFQKVSSVLQSQGLKYTKASSAKTAATLPSAESSLGRHIQNGDVFKKSKVETISHFREFSKPVTKETVRKDADIQPVLNGKAYNTTEARLKKRDLMSDTKDESLTPTANETVSAQVETSLRSEAKHIEIISDFGLEEQHFVEAPKKDKETLIFEKPNKEKIDFEVPVATDDHPSEDFGNIDEEHIIGKQEVVRQIVSCQRVYIEKEELVEPLEYENIETSVKVNNEEFRKVLDFSKPNTQDLDEPNVLSSDGVSNQGIKYALSQELDFDTQGSLNNADVENASQDKEDINQEADEKKENSKLNKGLELSHTEETSNHVEAKVDLQVEDMSVDQKFPVPSSSMEDVNQLIDDGQNFTKDIQDVKTTKMEDYNENPEKDTEVLQDTNIQVYNDNELDQQASRQEDNVFKADQCIDGKEEHTQFEQERQEVHDTSESMDHLSDEEVFKTKSKKVEEESCECEEEKNIINAEQNVQDFIDTEQSSIVVVKEVDQYSSQVCDDLKDIQHPSQEEKNNFQLNEQNMSYEDQENDSAKAPEETAQEFSDSNQEESKDQENKDVFDQRDNVKAEVSQLSEDVSDSQQPDLEELMSVDFSSTDQGIGGYFVENNQVVQTSDSKEGDSVQKINPDSKQEELHDIMQEEMVVSLEKHEDLQKFETEREQSDINLHSVQSTHEHNIQSSEGEKLERYGQLLEKDLTEKETTDINTNSVETTSSELKDVEEDKDNMSEENFEVCTTVEYTKSIKTEVFAQSINNEFESYEEDNATEKEGPTPAYEEDIRIPEHETEKEQEQGKEQYKDKEEDKQLFQESDVELNIAKEEGSLLQQDTEPIVENRSEVSTDMEQDNAKLHDHQDSEVDEDQASDRETSFQQESEDLIQSDEGHKESSKVALTAEEYSVSKEAETQSIEKDYDIMEKAQANSTMETDRNVKLNKVAESDPEDKSSFQQEVEEKEEEEQASNHQEVEERQEGYNQYVETGQELEEGTEIYHQELADGKGDYHQKVEIREENYYQEVEERQDDQHQDAEEGKEGYHQDDVEQNVGVSLKIFPNILRFTSAQTESEQEQSTRFSDEGTETHGDEIHVHGEEQTKNDLILEEKIKEQEVSENEIIHQQSTFPLEHECDNILSENSESQVVLSENLTEKNNFDAPTDNNLTEFNEMEGGDNMDKDNSKSEDPMDSQEGYYQETEEPQEGYHQELKVGEEGNHQEEDDQLGITENIASEEDHSRNQSIQKDSDVEQNVGVSLKIFPNILRFTSEHDAETQPEQEQSSKFSDEGTEIYGDEIHVHGEDQTKDDLIVEEKEQEVPENEIIHQKSTFPLENEQENILLENSESHVVLSENLTEKHDFDAKFNEMEEANNMDKDNSKSEDPVDSQKGYCQETEETQEGYHQEEEGNYQEEDQLDVEAISTLNENISSEEDHRRNQSIQNGSDEEKNVRVSLKILPNILQFTSENDAEAQTKQQKQKSELSYKGTETSGDMIHQEKFENIEQNNDTDLDANEQEISENEIIQPQSTFPLEVECENVLLENSKTHVVLAENTIEKYDSDRSIEEHLTELDETEATDRVDNNSKSEDSMDSQDISIYSQKSEEFEISKDYQLEQTLPDTTPLPTFDDEFEELAEDGIISASKQATEVTKLESSANGSESEEVLDSSLESQSSQVLAEVIEQSNLIADDHQDYNEQQDKNTKYLLESEHPQNFLEPRLNTEDPSGTSEEPAPKPVNSEMDAENSKPEESTASQEEVAHFLPKDDELGASEDSQFEKTQFETSPQENQVQLSSEQLVSESVNENHNDKLKESWPTLGEDTNEENVLTQTIDVAPSSEDTKLVPSLSHENKNIIKEHSDLVTQDFALDQRESVDTEDNERDFCEEDKKCVVVLTDNGEKEPSSKSLDEFSGDNVISSNVSEMSNEESEVNDVITGDTNQDGIKVDVRPLEESSENDDSVTSEESSPNVSTINYASEQEDIKTQCSKKSDVEGDYDSESPKELEQNVPLLTPEPVVETSLVEKIEPQTSSDEEKNLLVERSDSSFASMKEHEDTSELLTEHSEDGKTVNGIFRHTIIQATLDLDDHMFNGHSTKENSEIIISEAKMMRLDGDIVNSQSQVNREDSVIELTKSEGKGEGLFQSLLETSEHKESHFDEASEAKNIIQTAVKYVDSASEQSNYTKKLINPYLTERDLHESSEITSSVIDEDLVNTKQEIIETNQGLKINQEDQDAWSSDE